MRARRTLPWRTTFTFSRRGDCRLNVRSTPTPWAIRRTVKFAPAPPLLRRMTTPSNVCVRSRSPSTTFALTRTVSPGLNASTAVFSANSMRSLTSMTQQDSGPRLAAANPRSLKDPREYVGQLIADAREHIDRRIVHGFLGSLVDERDPGFVTALVECVAWHEVADIVVGVAGDEEMTEARVGLDMLRGLDEELAGKAEDCTAFAQRDRLHFGVDAVPRRRPEALGDGALCAITRLHFDDAAAPFGVGCPDRRQALLQLGEASLV